MALKHLDTTLSKSADMGKKWLRFSVYCHMNAPLGTKIMRTKVNLTFGYVLSMFVLFRELRFSRILLIVRAWKVAGSSEINYVTSELFINNGSVSLRPPLSPFDIPSRWLAGWLTDWLIDWKTDIQMRDWHAQSMYY
jgi:hypothetical protein